MGGSNEVAGRATPLKDPAVDRGFTVSLLLSVALLCTLKASGALFPPQLDMHWVISACMVTAALYAGKKGNLVPALLFSSLGAIYANELLESAGLPRPRIEFLAPGVLCFVAAIEPEPLPMAGRMLRVLGGWALIVGTLGLLYGPSLGVPAAPWGSEDYSLLWAILLPLAAISLGTITTRSWDRCNKAEGMVAVGLFPWLSYALLTLFWPSLLETWVGSPLTVATFQAWLCVAPVGYTVANLRDASS